MARESTPEKKKGNRSWKPSKMLQVLGKKAGFVYRWCDSDAARLQRHQSNGWIPASKITGHSKTEHTATDKSEQTSITEYRELVLHAMPAEEYEEHREYYREQNDQGLKALRRQLEKDLDSVRPGLGSKVTGKIIIE
jgi:hypothetical protein